MPPRAATVHLLHRWSVITAALTDTFAPIHAGAVTMATLDDLLLAAVGAHCVYAVVTGAARRRQAAALVYVCRRREGTLSTRRSFNLESPQFHPKDNPRLLFVDLLLSLIVI